MFSEYCKPGTVCPAGVEKTIFEYVPKWLIAMIFQKFGYMIHCKKNQLKSSIQKKFGDMSKSATAQRISDIFP